MDELQSKLSTLVADRLGVDVNELHAIDRLSEHADSLSIFDLISEIEEEFSIEIPDAEIKRMQSFNDLVSVVRSAKAAAGVS